MNTTLKIIHVLVGVSQITTAIFSMGCAGLGRTAAGLAGLVAPEHKATADNLYSVLLQDEVARLVEYEAVLVTRDGRVLRRPDVTPQLLPREKVLDWDSLPRGFWQTFLGEETTLSDEQAAQRKALADALATIPSTPSKEEKKK